MACPVLVPVQLCREVIRGHGSQAPIRSATEINMALTARAKSILEQMDPNSIYDAQELRAFAPELTPEGLHDVMRELWVQRQVERVGYSGWRRERSTSPASQAPRDGANRRNAGPSAARSKEVKPEDLFDHSAFEDMFR
jgi:hypothetical protein